MKEVWQSIPAKKSIQGGETHENANFFIWIHDQCLTEFQINCPKTRLVFKRLIFYISFISQ